MTRRITLRAEVDGPDQRNLWAYIDSNGNLRLEGQDLGPKTAPVSPDGEYEWFEKVEKSDIPRLLLLLGANESDDILDVLEKEWTGPRSYELTQIIRDSDIEVEIFVWS